MHVKNFLKIGALFLMVSIFTAGTVYSARTSEGDEIPSSTGEEAASDQPPEINEDFFSTAIPASETERNACPRERKAAVPDRSSARVKEEDSRLISIDFDNVDINLLIKFISELTQKNFWLTPMSRKGHHHFHHPRYLLLRLTGYLNRCWRFMASLLWHQEV
jgi:hypothetical protein